MRRNTAATPQGIIENYPSELGAAPSGSRGALLQPKNPCSTNAERHWPRCAGPVSTRHATNQPSQCKGPLMLQPIREILVPRAIRRSIPDMLSAEQQTAVDALLDDLLDLPVDRRAQRLRSRHVTDPVVLAEVESLLRA